MATLFSKIIAGEIPSYKVAENDYAFAFLDIFPLVKGHTLVVPKIEVNRLFDLPEPHYHELWKFAKEVSRAINATFPCDRVGSSVIGLEVPHAHIHLMPINTMDDMNFARPKLELSEGEFKDIAQSLHNFWK
ncbi:MAG: HIT family protein [Schleiferiaceae bacterium]